MLHLGMWAAMGAAALPAAGPGQLPGLTPPAALPDVTSNSVRFNELFEPFRTDIAALSPDGNYLAYSVRDSGNLAVLVIDVAHPQVAKARVIVASDATSTPMEANASEVTPAKIRWMGWATPTRLVVETNTSYPTPIKSGGTLGGAQPVERWITSQGAILAFDADGENARTLVTPADMRAGSYIRVPHVFGYCPGEPDSLLIRSGEFFTYDPLAPVSLYVRMEALREFGLFKVNVLTGRRKWLEGYLHQRYREKVPLLNRQGRPGVGISDANSVPYPHDFYYLAGSLWERPKPLDRLAGFAGTAGFSVSPENFFGERAVPLGFSQDPDLLYYASNVGRDTYGIYGLNLKTGRRADLKIEDPQFDLYQPQLDGLLRAGMTTMNQGRLPPVAEFPYHLRADDGPLVFDRYTGHLLGVRYDAQLETTRWLLPEWQAMQAELETALPGRSVEIQGWDEAENKFLVLVRGPADPGAYYIFDRASGKMEQFVLRSPWFEGEKRNSTEAFAFPNPAGGRITGLITLPAGYRTKPFPLVVLCPNWPWDRVSSDYQPEVEALADMGFAVAQFDGRGAWGFGVKQRAALKSGYAAAQAADVMATVEQLAKRFPINPRRVALFGQAHGGFVALRALQLYPGKFRCAVTIDPLVDLGGWLADQHWGNDLTGPELVRPLLGNAATLTQAPLVCHPEKITRPVLLLCYPGAAGQPRTPVYLAACSFVRTVRAHGAEADFVELGEGYPRGLPQARAAAFQRIESFLNDHLYEYKVDAGTPVELKN